MDAEEKHKYELEKERKEKEDAISRLMLMNSKKKQSIASEYLFQFLSVIDYRKENAESIKQRLIEWLCITNKMKAGINDE